MLCCLIFLAFIVGMIGTSGYGYLHGDVQLLLTGWDSDGNGCGYDKVTKDYPFLYFPSIDATKLQEAAERSGTAFDKGEDGTSINPSEVLKYTACVKSCPSEVLSEPVECYKTTDMTEGD